MPHSPHRRRHRSHDRSSPRIHRSLTWPVLLLGTFVLGVISARTPLGLATALIAGAGLTMLAYLTLSCLAGRVAAEVRNAFSLHSAYNDLGRFMRSNETFRAARRGVSRTAH